MSKKGKNEELNFLYMDDDNKIKKNNKRAENKSAPRKNKSSNNKPKDQLFNFEEEIVIGVTRKNKGNVKESNNKQVKNTKTKKDTPKKNIDKKTKQRIKNNRKTQKKRRSLNLVGQTFKWLVLISALIASIIFFMMSPLFNIVEIKVNNNEKISKETVISLSKIQLGENLYKYSKRSIEKNIKQNPYIENVNIKRKLPNILEINVEERKTTFLIEYGSSYIYINNQGYILEISQEKLELPIIVGITTEAEQLVAGSRLNVDDLERLEVVLKIIESANSNSLAQYISKINIEDKQNYALTLETENKVAYLGDGSNLSNKMLYLKVIIEKEKGKEGEIFLNGDINKDKVFFREKI